MKKIGLYLLVIVAILVSGCITLSVDSKVNSKGELVKYNMVIDTNSVTIQPDNNAIIRHHSKYQWSKFLLNYLF